MRYQVTVIDPKGRISLNTAYHEQHPAYDQQIVDLLVRASVHGLVMAYKDGSHTQFGPMEYECELCDSYAHEAKDCPERDDDDPPWSVNREPAESGDDISWSPDDGSE